MNLRLDLTSLKNALQSLDLALSKEKDEVIYHTARNTTSHTYNASIAEQVYEVARKFSSDAHFLLNKLIEIHR